MKFVQEDQFGDTDVMRWTDYQERDTDSIAVNIGMVVAENGFMHYTIEGVLPVSLLAHLRGEQ